MKKAKWVKPTDVGYDDWCLDIIDEHLSDKFYYANEDMINEDGGVFDMVLSKLWKQGLGAKEAAEYVEKSVGGLDDLLKGL